MEGHTTYYFSRGHRGFCPSFWNSPTPATYPHIFSPTFDLNSHCLLHGTAKRLNYTLIRPSCTTPRDTRPVGRAIHGPHSPLDAVEPNLHRHPIRPSSTRSLASVHSPRLTEPSLYLLFSKQNFQNYFWALSRGPRGFCPSFSNFPTPAAYPQIFSDVSTPIFHPCLFRFIPRTHGLD